MMTTKFWIFIFLLISTDLFGQQLLYRSHINSIESGTKVEVPWLGISENPFSYLLDRYIVFVNPDNNNLINDLVTVQVIAQKANKIRIIETFSCPIGEDQPYHLYSTINIKKGEILIFTLFFTSNVQKDLIFDIYTKEKQFRTPNTQKDDEMASNNSVIYKEKKIKIRKMHDKSLFFRVLRFTVKLSSELL